MLMMMMMTTGPQAPSFHDDDGEQADRDTEAVGEKRDDVDLSS